MGGHGVPYRTGHQLGQPHLELAGTFFEHVVDDKLVDDAVVAFFHLAGFEAVGLYGSFAAVDGDELGLVCLVGRSRVDVEFGGVGIVLAAECHIAFSAADVDGVLEV